MTRTPFSMFALMSPGYKKKRVKRVSFIMETKFKDPKGVTDLNIRRKRHRAREPSKSSFVHGIAFLLLLLLGHGALPRDDQTVLVDVDVDIFLCHPGQLDGGNHLAGVFGLAKIHSG